MSPAFFYGLDPDPERVATVRMSHHVASVLIAGYVAWLRFSLWTHTSEFRSDRVPAVTVAPKWSSKKATGILVAAAIGIGVVREVLVSATGEAVKVPGRSEFFVGLILIAISRWVSPLPPWRWRVSRWLS